LLPGIGFYTAQDLARRNARVILACRSQEKGEAAVRAIIEETGNTAVMYRHLDVSLLASVRGFVADFLSNETRLDILVNNAGVAGHFNFVSIIHIALSRDYKYKSYDSYCLMPRGA